MFILAATLAACRRRRPRWVAVWTAAAILALTPASEGAPALSVQFNGTNRISISWPGEGTLQSSPEVAGPWTNLPSANSPYVTGTAGGRNFFRLALPVVFSPTNVPGLRLWLDAGAGVALDGDAVSQWEDQSGRSNHAASEG